MNAVNGQAIHFVPTVTMETREEIILMPAISPYSAQEAMVSVAKCNGRSSRRIPNAVRLPPTPGPVYYSPGTLLLMKLTRRWGDRSVRRAFLGMVCSHARALKVKTAGYAECPVRSRISATGAIDGAARIGSKKPVWEAEGHGVHQN